MSQDKIKQLNSLFKNFKIVELSHSLEEGMPTYPTHSKFYHLLWDSPSDPAVMYQILLHEHNGTHIDAPLHFMKKAPKREYGIDKVPLNKLIGPCVTLNFSSSPPNHTVTKEEIQKWEEENSPIEKEDIVIFNFGWWKKWKPLPEGEEVIKNWPGLGKEAAEYLLEKKVKAVGTDCMALDSYSHVIDGTAPVHKLLLPNGVLILENLDNLDNLPLRSFFIALPLKIKEGSGSPIRAVALVPH